MKTINHLLITLLLFLAPVAMADTDNEKVTLRIGTGGTAGTYFPIGSVIADAINNIKLVNDDQNTPAPKLVAIAQRSSGSVSNVTDMNNGLLDVAFAQANVIHWAYNGTGPFKNQKPNRNLKGLAALYLESLHLVVRYDAPIENVYDLVGKNVSLDEIGSGTQLDIQTILQAYQLEISSLNAVYLKTSDAIDRIRNNELDAFFLLAGYPVNAVAQLVEEGKARIIPITGAPVDSILESIPYFTIDEIPNNTYGNTESIQTIGVPAQMVIDGRIPSTTAYRITKALWSKSNLKALCDAHPKGCEIRPSSALRGMHILLHTGARQLYEEHGLIRIK